MPDDIVAQLRQSGVDVSRDILEAFALEGYRSERLSSDEVMRLLGFDSRIELDAFLKQHEMYLWTGLLLSVVAFLSYPFFFASFPLTRDFPWANLPLFALAVVLLLVGVRRAFAPDRSRKSKIAGLAVTTLGVLILGFFIFTAFIMARWLPASSAAPHLGQKAPDFNLVDTNNKPVSLSELLTSPINGQAPKGVLLIFYRGYW